jgi:ABC-type transport system involved in multi-copper enzyme maturation permease subunit
MRRLLRSEWTKLWTVRSWAVTVVLVAVIMVTFSWLVSFGSHAGICNGPGPGSCHGEPAVPVGPDGEAIADTYYYLHEPLAANGSVTVQVTSLRGVTSTAGNRVEVGTNLLAQSKPALAPWAKAGILITPSLATGSRYAAVMVTGTHGVRLQDDYVHDTPGIPGAVTPTSPRWLRLTRSGDTLTGSDSTDGARWTTIGTTHLNGLSGTVQAGLFVTSPDVPTTSRNNEGTYATATFNQLIVTGAGTTAHLAASNVGAGPGYGSLAPGRYQHRRSQYIVGGSGDIGPLASGAGGDGTLPDTGLLGAFGALIIVAILGGRYITSEYRGGLIRTTFTATPNRSRVLAAKAIIIATTTFVPSLIGTVAAFVLSRRVQRSNGNALLPITTSTEIRAIVGTAALIAITAVLALALGAIVRRGAVAVTVIVVTTVLPLILALSVTSTIGTWLLRVSPAAGFAIQQSVVHYSQVSDNYTPVNGYFPLPPWAGLAVLCAWTALAMTVASRLLRRRDA